MTRVAPPGPSSPGPSWSLHGFEATDAERGVRLDLAAPGLGLVRFPAGDRLLGLDLAAAGPPVEHWIRGTDLIAVYEPGDARRLRATACWRPLADAEAAAWELVVSAQTALGVSDSALAVTSDVAASEVLWGTAAGDWTTANDPRAERVLVRRRGAAGAGTSVLVAVHPADVRRIVVARQEQRARIACWLFSSTIEKGVLLRSRVLAAIGPTAGDTHWAAALGERFAATPSPLTA